LHRRLFFPSRVRIAQLFPFSPVNFDKAKLNLLVTFSDSPKKTDLTL